MFRENTNQFVKSLCAAGNTKRTPTPTKKSGSSSFDQLIPTQPYQHSSDEDSSTSGDHSTQSSSSNSSSGDDSTDTRHHAKRRQRAERDDMDANDRARKKVATTGDKTDSTSADANSRSSDSEPMMDFKLPDVTTEEPYRDRVVASPYHIVTTSRRSEEMARVVDASRRMHIGELHRLSDIDLAYPIAKQRGPYGDGLPLLNTIFKVDYMITNETDQVVHVVLVDHCTDRQYLLDDRFFDDWAYVRNVDLDKMRGPAHKQFFV